MITKTFRYILIGMIVIIAIGIVSPWIPPQAAFFIGIALTGIVMLSFLLANHVISELHLGWTSAKEEAEDEKTEEEKRIERIHERYENGEIDEIEFEKLLEKEMTKDYKEEGNPKNKI